MPYSWTSAKKPFWLASARRACVLVALVAFALPLRAQTYPVVCEGLKRDPFGLAFALDGKKAAVDQDDGIKVFDTVTGKELAVVKPELHIESCYPVGFLADGKELVYADGERIFVWDSKKSAVSRTIKPPRDMRLCRLIKRGDALAFVGTDQVLTVMDLNSGKAIKEIKLDKAPNYMAASEDGKWAVAGRRDDLEVVLYDLTTGKVSRTIDTCPEPELKGKVGGVRDLAFSTDGKALFTLGYFAGLLRVWDTATGKGVDQIALGKPIDGVRAMACAPDGKSVVVIGGVRKNEAGEYKAPVGLWDMRARGVYDDDLFGYFDVKRTAGASSEPKVFFSPHGKKVAILGDGKSFELWDARRSGDKEKR
jgi:WD40 repeat protein